MTKFENFETAFDPGIGSCSAMCECGKIFYNPDGSWGFEEGELEGLEADEKAVSLDHSVGYVSFEGSEYVYDCDCWHDRAKQIINFIDGHRFGIVKYLKAEKERKQIEADVSPVV